MRKFARIRISSYAEKFSEISIFMTISKSNHMKMLWKTIPGLWNLSTMPLACGWKAVVLLWMISSKEQMADHKEEEKSKLYTI